MVKARKVIAGRMLVRTYRAVGKLFPKSVREHVRQTLGASAKEDTLPEEVLGAAIVVSFVYSFAFVLIPWLLLGLTGAIQLFIGIIAFMLIFFLYYLLMCHAIEKARKIELEPKRFKILPERFMIKLYYSISRFFPWRFREQVRQMLIYSGDKKTTPEEWLGEAFLVSFLYAVIASILLWGYGFGLISLLGWLVSLGLGLFFHYLLLYYATENRRKYVEEVLPDFLQLIAANIRAGMTPFAALRASSRPEFGPLEKEVKYATSKSLGTGSFTAALKEAGETINSEMFARVISLFSSGLKSGGKLSALLENAAQDISETQELKEQLVTSTRMYSMFILFNIAVGSPLMLAIAMQFVDMVSSLSEVSAGGELAKHLGGGLMIKEMPLTTDFLLQASIVIITVTCFLASGFIGVINEGKVKNGLKYFPVLALVSLALFFIFRVIVSSILTALV